MKTIKSILVLCMLVVMVFMVMTSCSIKDTIKTMPENGICLDAPEDSVLCKVFPNIERVNDIIVTVNTTAILTGVISKKQALHGVEKLRLKINGLTSYQYLVTNSMSLGLIFIDADVEKLKKHTRIISVYDRGLLNRLCDNLIASINIIPDKSGGDAYTNNI